MSNGYELTKKGIVEVYKAVVSYVMDVDVPIRLTRVLINLEKSGVYPEVIKI